MAPSGSTRPPDPPAGEAGAGPGTPHQSVGADQVSRLNLGPFIGLIAAAATFGIGLLCLADYWVWIHVSQIATFEAIVAESNVALAIAATFAILSASGETKNTREMLRQIHLQHMEMHKMNGVRSESGDRKETKDHSK